jgi:hypothetical protein
MKIGHKIVNNITVDVFIFSAVDPVIINGVIKANVI